MGLWVVVDLFLDALFGVAGFLVGLFPVASDVADSGIMGSGYGPMYQLGEYLYFVNYVLPLAEMFEMLRILIPVILLLALVRFLVSLIPGVG